MSPAECKATLFLAESPTPNQANVGPILSSSESSSESSPGVYNRVDWYPLLAGADGSAVGVRVRRQKSAIIRHKAKIRKP